MRKRLIASAVVFACIGLLAQGGPASPKTIKLAWNANSETDLVGYGVYWGIVASGSTNYTQVSTNAATLTSLANGSYWFAVTAKNTLGIESDFSNIVFASIPNKPTNLRTVP